MTNTRQHKISKSLAALALAGALTMPAKADDKQANPSQPATTTIQMSTNVAPYGVAKDIELVEDFSAVITHETGGVKFKLYEQSNGSGNFAGNKDYLALDAFIKTKGWTLSPGVKFVTENGHTARSATLSAAKSFKGNTLTMAVGGGDTDRKGGVYLQGKVADAAVFYLRDTVKNTDNVHYSAGIHGKNAGVWFTQNAGKDRGLAITLDKSVGAYFFGKDRADGTAFGLAQIALGNTPGTNDYFSIGTGQFTSWVLADQLPRPKFRDLASYLSLKGSVVGQVAYNKDASGTYVEAQAGKTLYSEHGASIALGAGARYFEMPDGSKKLLGSGEAFVRVPLGKVNADLTGRFEQKPEGGLAATISLTGKYKF